MIDKVADGELNRYCRLSILEAEVHMLFLCRQPRKRLFACLEEALGHGSPWRHHT